MIWFYIVKYCVILNYIDLSYIFQKSFVSNKLTHLLTISTTHTLTQPYTHTLTHRQTGAKQIDPHNTSPHKEYNDTRQHHYI
jgi:hypothetical protein